MIEYNRTSEEIKKNYEASLKKHGNKNVQNSGVEKGVRATAFVTAKLVSEYIPGSLGIAKTFYNAAIERLENGTKVPDAGAPYFIELRYKSTEKIIQKMIERFGEIQVVELASGFTSHGLSMIHENQDIKKWIDNDFEASLDIKQDVANSLVSGAPIEYVPGDALDKKTWDKIKSLLLSGIPVVVFCEGLMMYLNKEEREVFFSNIVDILDTNGGVFMHEDLLKYQKGNKEIESGRSAEDFACMTKQVKEISGNQNNKALDEFYSQDEVVKEYTDYGFNIERFDESELASLSLDRYPKEVFIKTPTIDHVMHPQQNGEDLLKAGFKMWVLNKK